MRKTASRVLDMTPLRKVLDDEKQWVGKGVVVKPDDAPDYYEIDGDDILIEVSLKPGDEVVTCRLQVPGSGGAYLLGIPDVGDEVAVVLPRGELHYMPICLGCIGYRVHDRAGPQRVILVSDKRLEIIAPEICISSDGTSGEPLARKSDFDNHVHPTGVGPSGTPNNAATSGTKKVKGE